MQILSLRFQNLNALQGEWYIDFTHTAYVNQGIFAITGATGAGKTTILDGICLALYGATPRLGEISESKNDIMSKQTGECYAEVVFATQKGSYRCFWGQKRAYKKPNGKLQSPKHEIALYVDDNTTGQILADKSKLTKAKVEQLTGMDFQRFTRSMLLAQGDFASFLKASADERSPILEQITGTEIYSKISLKVNELRAEAKKQLEIFQAKSSQIQLLDLDNEQQLQQQKNHLLTHIDTIKNQIHQTEIIKTWREQWDFIEQKFLQLQQTKEHLTNQEQQLLPQRQQLTLAKQALELSADFATLNHQRNQQQQYQQQLNNQQQKYQQLQRDYQHQVEKLQMAEQNFKNIKERKQIQEPILVQLAQLEIQQQQSQQQLDINEQNLKILQQNQQQIHQQHTETQQQYQQAQIQNQQLQQQIQQLPIQVIVRTLGQLETLEQNWQNLQQQQKQITEQLTTYQKQQQTTNQNIQNCQNNQQEQQNNYQQYRASLQTLQDDMLKIMQGQGATALQYQQQQCWQIQQRLSLILPDCQILKENCLQKINIYQQIQPLPAKISQIDEQLSSILQQISQTKQTVDLLNDKKMLLVKIGDLSQERALLEEGKPCPLCGSTHHPLNDDINTQSDELVKTQESYQQAVKNLEQQQQNLQTMLISKNSLSKDLEILQQAEQKICQNIKQNLKKITEKLTQFHQYLPEKTQDLMIKTEQISTINLDNLDSLLLLLENIEQFLLDYQQSLDHRIQSLQDTLQKLEQYQTKQSQLEQKLQAINQQITDSQQQLSLWLQQKQHQQIKQQELQQHYQDNLKNIKNLNQQIMTIIMPLQSLLPSVDLDWQSSKMLNSQQLTDIKTVLSEQQQTHQQQTKFLENLQPKIEQLQLVVTDLSHQLTMLNEQIISENQKQMDLQQQLENQRQQQQQLRKKHQLSLVDCIENIQIELQKNYHKIHEIYQSMNDNVQSIYHQKQTLIQQLNEIQQQIDKQQIELQSNEQLFYQNLQKLGLKDEQAYQEILLSTSQRESLQQKINDLDREWQSYYQENQAVEQKLQQYRQQKMTENSVFELSNKLNQLKDELGKDERSLGAVVQQLQFNEQQKQQQQAILSQMQTLQTAYSEWQQLHDLIGSSDGKKYRNFAQGLTFNLMIAYANQQLQKMSERYLLLADTTQPLSLNVLDNYQGGEIRTSKNLSGGESFIISLALALGLSNMASHQMQVNSLFLDEGFGTLDDEALDVALDTLTNLQQTGKLIGVISHIPALKERISNQIQVIPLSGGVSKIIGHGCQRLD